MARTRGMDEPDADFPGVPIGDVRFLPEFPRTGESFADALEVVAKPVGDENRAPVRALDQILQGVELSVVQTHGLSFSVVDGAGRHLQELSRKRGGVHGVDFLAIDFRRHVVF